MPSVKAWAVVAGSLFHSGKLIPRVLVFCFLAVRATAAATRRKVSNFSASGFPKPTKITFRTE